MDWDFLEAISVTSSWMKLGKPPNRKPWYAELIIRYDVDRDFCCQVSIKTLADDSTNVILAGDIKQLGPNARSPIARALGLQKSYIDRLMGREIYNLKEWTGITYVRWPIHGGICTETLISIVTLVKSFRSHRCILRFPNDMFYNGELQPMGVRDITHSLLQSDVLVKKGFPIVFHGIVGKEEREGSSPSFFNIDEASLVREYCEQLIKPPSRSRRRRNEAKPVCKSC